VVQAAHYSQITQESKGFHQQMLLSKVQAIKSCYQNDISNFVTTKKRDMEALKQQQRQELYSKVNGWQRWAQIEAANLRSKVQQQAQQLKTNVQNNLRAAVPQARMMAHYLPHHNQRSIFLRTITLGL
jgi:hypothetical protein